VNEISGLQLHDLSTASKDISLTKKDAPFYNAKSTGCFKAHVALEKSQNENPSEIYLLGIP
jgi:hypothetical protein